MEKKRAIITSEFLRKATERAALDSKSNVNKNYCAQCSNTSLLSLMVITNQPCGICGTFQQFGSSDTDILCKKCAVQHSLCAHCAADIRLDTTRDFSSVLNSVKA